MVHTVLAGAQGQQLPSRGNAVVFLLAGLAATAWSWVVVTNFRGPGDRILKDSQESARSGPAGRARLTPSKHEATRQAGNHR